MTTLDTKPLAQLTREALRLLYDQLGPADTLRFLNQYTTGYGNYTAERRAQVEELSLDELVVELTEFEARRTFDESTPTLDESDSGTTLR